jgi:fructose-bisphosphate aldolase class I
LVKNKNMIASFSRALMEGITFQMTDAEFNSSLDGAIQSIYDASKK